jgi:DNA-binding transcriptional regulator YiaG
MQKSSNFSSALRAVRGKLGLSQEELAGRLGVSFATVNRWENGWTVPSKLALRQIDLLCQENHIEPVTETKRSAK